MVSSIGRELEHLVQSHISQPDVVLLVHRDHVGKEEQVLAPGVDDVTSSIDSKYSVLGDGFVLLQAIGVVTANIMDLNQIK